MVRAAGTGAALPSLPIDQSESPMLSAFRKKLTSWLMLGVLGLALIALVVTGFGTDGMGGLGGIQPGATTLANVEGRRVTETELSDAVSRQYRQAQQQQPELTLNAFLAGGTFDQMLTQMIIGAALMEFGQDQGLSVSQRMIDREIVAIPAFRNFAGQFDESTFRQALAEQNLTEAQLREEIARSIMQRQLLLPIAYGSRVPEGLAREYASLLLERRQGAIGVVPAELMNRGIEPSAEEVAAFYRDNQDRFTIPERRVFRYAVIGPEQVNAAAQATDQEIQAFYQQNQAQYGPRERRSLQQVVLPDQQAAQAFRARLQGGASFADAASQAGFAPADINLGVQTPQQFAQISSQEVARAAFAAAEGEVIGPVRSDFGHHVVRVEDVSRTEGRPLSAVRDEIAASIEERKQADALGALITQIEDQLAEGASFEEVVQAANLQARQTPPVTAGGQVPSGQAALANEAQALLRPAFEMSPDDEPLVETIDDNARFAVMNVEQVVPAAPPPLAEIQSQVREALIRQRALERARTVGQAIVAKVEKGMPLRQAFSEAGANLPAPQPVDMRRMEISQSGERVPPPLAMMFSLPEGAARILEAPNQAGWFVVFHEKRTPGDAGENPELVQTTRQQFSQVAGEEMAQQFARAVEMRAEIVRNEDAIRQARQRLTGGAAE